MPSASQIVKKKKDKKKDKHREKSRDHFDDEEDNASNSGFYVESQTDTAVSDHIIETLRFYEASYKVLFYQKEALPEKNCTQGLEDYYFFNYLPLDILIYHPSDTGFTPGQESN